MAGVIPCPTARSPRASPAVATRNSEFAVELLDVEPGKTVTLERVLLVADGDDATIGQPVVEGAAVSAEVVRQARGEKLIAFKYRPKARSRVKKGHRQELTTLRIADITFGGKSAAKDAKQAEDKARSERVRLEEAAAAQAAKDAELAAKLAADKPVKAEPKAKASTSAAKAKPEPKADAKAEPKAKADATTQTKTAAPKKTTAKADTDATDAKAAPKKPRATKKDE